MEEGKGNEGLCENYGGRNRQGEFVSLGEGEKRGRGWVRNESVLGEEGISLLFRGSKIRRRRGVWRSAKKGMDRLERRGDVYAGAKKALKGGRFIGRRGTGRTPKMKVELLSDHEKRMSNHT